MTVTAVGGVPEGVERIEWLPRGCVPGSPPTPNQIDLQLPFPPLIQHHAWTDLGDSQGQRDVCRGERGICWVSVQG